MDKRGNKQYIAITLTAATLAICAVIMAKHRLSEYASNEYYIISGRDILNVIFMSNDFKRYPYLDKSDMRVWISLFLFYIVGIILLNYCFLSKSGEYYCLIYSRAESKKSAVKFMRGNSLKKTICYSGVYSLVCYSGMIACMNFITNKTAAVDDRLFMELILHTIVLVLMLILLQRIMLFVYVKLNGAYAFMTGVVVITIVLILDMQMKGWSIILFSSNHFYADSIGLLGTINMIWYFIENKFLYTQLPYEGGNEN